MKKPRRWKKPRGKKNIQHMADYVHWREYQKAYARASVSDITKEGFVVHTPSKDYYIKRDPWFTNATDEELRYVRITLDLDNTEEGDDLFWPALGEGMHANYIDNPPPPMTKEEWQAYMQAYEQRKYISPQKLAQMERRRKR